MRFYLDVIKDLDLAKNGDLNKSIHYKYFTWSDETIGRFWHINSINPITSSQFYPKIYWLDILSWFAKTTNIQRLRQVVDIGCGSGNMIECLLQIIELEKCIGVDISREAIAYIEQRFEKHNNVEFRHGSIDQLPLENNSIDFITCTEVLEHLFPTAFHQGFTEIDRVLKPEGYFLASLPIQERLSLVVCPNCQTLYTPYQHMIFEITEKDIIVELEKNNMKLVAFYYPVNRSQPANPVKKLLKNFIITASSKLSYRLFPKAGVNGFLAKKC
jgi:ubiquinone/menaquinone biosynthesis C-methylase UbiE